MTKLTAQEELERGFICRMFYTRGKMTMSTTYSKAKELGVDPSWFTDPFSKVVWMSAEDLFKSEDFRSVTLLKLVMNAKKVASNEKDIELRTVRVGLEDFESLEKYVRPDDGVESYVKILQDALVTRRAKEQIAKAVEALGSGEDPVSAVSKLIVGSQDVLKLKNPCKTLSIGELCDNALKDWDEAYHQRTELGNYEWCPGIPLPWRKLAYCLNGFNPDVTILAARPGVGKTSMAMNFARYWLDIGKKVVFVSVDMSPIGFAKRSIAERARISSRKLQFGKSLDYKEDRERVVSEINTLKEFEKTGNFTLLGEYDIDKIRSACSIMKDQGNIDVLIIDYLQLLKFRGSERLSTTQKTTYISNTVHELAVSLGLPVLCLSQLNRDNTKDGGREPQISDLRDSGAIEQDAANVLLLYRNESLNKKWRDEAAPIQFAKNRMPSNALNSYCPIWCSIAKCRDGDCGTKLPFVVVQNKYAWYLGDFEADGDAKFERVYDDWRHDPIENVWAENGSLIRMEDVRAIERTNINAERRQKGLPEIVWNS